MNGNHKTFGETDNVKTIYPSQTQFVCVWGGGGEGIIMITFSRNFAFAMFCKYDISNTHRKK